MSTTLPRTSAPTGARASAPSGPAAPAVAAPAVAGPEAGTARPEAPVPAVPPTETPECEASTCHGISLPEPVELHDAWPGWIPIALIAVLVIACAGFAVARIAAF